MQKTTFKNLILTNDALRVRLEAIDFNPRELVAKADWLPFDLIELDDVTKKPYKAVYIDDTLTETIGVFDLLQYREEDLKDGDPIKKILTTYTSNLIIKDQDVYKKIRGLINDTRL